MAYLLNSLSIDFDADPCGYEAPTGLAVDFDRACLPGSTHLNLCGTPGSTTLNLGCYKSQLIVDLATAFSVLFSTSLSIPSITLEEGSVTLAFSTLVEPINSVHVSDDTVFLIFLEFLRTHVLVSKGNVILETLLLENLAVIKKVFTAAVVSAQFDVANNGLANSQGSALFSALKDAAIRGRASVVEQVPLTLVFSFFYTALTTCFSTTQLNNVVALITAHFIHAYAETTTSVQCADHYVKSLHYNAYYIESIISYVGALGRKFDLGVVTSDGRIIRLQMEDNVVRISFSDKLSDVTGVFEKTLIASPTVRIIQLINSDKIELTG